VLWQQVETLGQGQEHAHDEAHQEAAYGIHCQGADGEMRAKAHAYGGGDYVAADGPQTAAYEDVKIIAHFLFNHFLLCYKAIVPALSIDKASSWPFNEAGDINSPPVSSLPPPLIEAMSFS